MSLQPVRGWRVMRGVRGLGVPTVRAALVFAVVSLLFAGPQLIGEASPSLQVTPPLGRADSFAILASTYTNTAAGTIIDGDLGYTTGPAVAPTVNGSTFSPPSAKYSGAGTDQGAALANLNGQTCTYTFPAGAIDLATDVSRPAPAVVGVYPAGVYCITGAASVGAGGITLTGPGTFIFRMSGALTTVANSTVSLAAGASSCNLFWTPTGATTLGANSTFRGTDIDPAGITIGSTVTWDGRALAFGGTVSTASDRITATNCSVAATPTSTPPAAGADSNDGGPEPTSVPVSVPATSVPATSVPATAVPATAVPATAVPATATRTATAVPATATQTSVPPSATLPPATTVPTAIPTLVPTPEAVVLAEGLEGPDLGIVVVDVPVAVEIPVLIPIVAPVAPQPQVVSTPTPRPTAPAISFPNTGTGPAPALLPTTGATGGSLAGLLTVAGAALAVGGARWAKSRGRDAR